MKWTHNDIEWGSHLGAPYHEGPRGAEEFVIYSRQQLEPFHISSDVVDQLRSADCEVKGVRYFTDLYEDNGLASVGDMMESVFVGSVAHGRADLATEAYDLLMVLDVKNDVPKINKSLIEKMDKAMKQERWYGRALRHDRLAAASKVLGKPMRKRFLGGLAAAQALHARS